MSSEQYIKVYKNPGESLGLGFNKNSEEQNKVFAILEGSALQRSKQITPGDLIVQINGRDVRKFSSGQLIDMISTLQDDTEVSLKVAHPNSTNGTPRGMLCPAISVDSEEKPSVENGVGENRRPARMRKTPVTSDNLPKITESDEQVNKPKPMLLQPLHNVGKRLSLIPETKHRELPAIQPSKSLDLGTLPTWRNKTFINLQNYWTGEQCSDRLHTQAEQVWKVN